MNRTVVIGIAVSIAAVAIWQTGKLGQEQGSSLLSKPAYAAESHYASFGDYWYQGKAEVTSYRLQQAHHGEFYERDAVLIFVTEDFSRSKHVKLDNPEAAGTDAVKVLKLNAMKNFTTGIYPYSLMASVFAPIDRPADPRALKVTMSMQEWCGQSFVQMNLRGAAYAVQQNSYFETEGDKTIEVEAAIPEDELWTTMRLNPKDLPTGSLRLIPGVMVQRLKHSPWAVQSAEATLSDDPADPALKVYTVTYPTMNRTLSIRFRAAFPYEIESWEETYPDGFGKNAKTLTTTATLNNLINSQTGLMNAVKRSPTRFLGSNRALNTGACGFYRVFSIFAGSCRTKGVSVFRQDKASPLARAGLFEAT